MEESSPQPPRRRKVAHADAKMPLWFWLGPIGGSALLGILTVVVLFSGRGKQPVPHKEEKRPIVKRPQAEKPPPPRVEVPPPPTDYSIPKVDYTKGEDGKPIALVVDTPSLRREGFVNEKGKTIIHGKTQEFFRDSKKPKSEEWYALGSKHGPSVAWNEDGTKTTEGQFFRGEKHGKWTSYRRNGSVDLEEMWYRGKKLGPTTTFHANGKKARTMNYKNSRRTGPAEVWDESGKPLTPVESLRADLETVGYDDMIDILGTPTDLHEVPRTKGTLLIWARPGDRYIAVWVVQDPKGMYTKKDIRAFQVSRDAIDKLAREIR